MKRATKDSYIGRFAPSPSGPLHFGSLVCALASYLDARASNGIWLVRMEDIDPPREQAGAKSSILRSLEHHGLYWDDEVLYQSQRADAYHEALKQLTDHGFSYRCNCTRKRLASLREKGLNLYDQYCLHHPPSSSSPSSVRLHLNAIQATATPGKNIFQYQERLQTKENSETLSIGDFVIHRKDGLFAYNLAVVVDDIAQGVTDIVRGTDLLETTPQQRALFYGLEKIHGVHREIRYAHLPVVIDSEGRKLSKQNHAPAIDDSQARKNLLKALALLLNTPPPSDATIDEILCWGIEHWDISHLHKVKTFRNPLEEATVKM